MSARDQSTPMPAAPTQSMGSALRAVFGHRGVQIAAALWVAAYVVVVWLARGSLPFDRPALAQLPFAVQMAAPTVGLIEIFVLMLLTYMMTRKRVIPDMAARALRIERIRPKHPRP